MKNDPFGFVPPNPPSTQERQADFDQLEALELYCPTCRQAVPVRKFLLLILPDGDKYEYRCQYCGTKVGGKMDKSGQYYGVLNR
ncbi:MAG: hypothetical protein WAL98_00340 [Desulfatiglandaceae bacterium]|jgi:DNA-directed RNA polymerase subunit RPC12/RpoP